jgi:glycosyltransferase involved in cell wall biosynthesis
MSKQKIVIVSMHGTKNMGGVERVCYYLNEILSKHFETEIIAKVNINFGKFDIVIQSMVMSIRLLFIRNKIVFSNSWMSFLYPVDFSIQHGTTGGCQLRVPEVAKSPGAHIMRLFEKISCKTARNVVAVGKNAALELEELYHVRPSKIKILTNFVDEKIFYPITNQRENENHITILFSGRLEKRKGLDALKKLSNYIEKDKKYNLLIACNDKQGVELFLKNIRTRIFVGLHANEMNEFYNSGDILFFPTKYEGFSMATLEALSCGIPVIGTEYAIPSELRNFDFTKICDTTNIDSLIYEINKITVKYRERKKEIHEIIKYGFGFKQYKKKLLQLIGK